MEKIFDAIEEIKERIANNTTASMSNYPEKIDFLPFIEDAKLSNVEWRKNYEELIKSDVLNAVNSLSTNKQFVPQNAFLFNMLQDRIIETQKFLLTKEDSMERIELSEEPSVYVDGKTWLIQKK